MGPGLLGQLLDLAAEDSASHQACLRCHAPLQEQGEALAKEIRSRRAAGLHREGMVCAACHVREGQWFGPPTRDGRQKTLDPAWPHGGFQSSSAYEDSRFCASCHQFEPDDYALNNKLLENTYNEWAVSRHAREGRSCQSCHMPDRRHLFRGIHDPETTRRGVDIDSAPPQQHPSGISARLRVRNQGTGHHFPTYVTPLVRLEGVQLSSAGETLPGTQQEALIGRQVSLDLSREISDTRIPSDGEKVFDYHRPLASGAVSLRLRIMVEPDAFYTAFYESTLAGNQWGPRGQPLILRALAESKRSHYVLWEQVWPLDASKAARQSGQ